MKKYITPVILVCLVAVAAYAQIIKTSLNVIVRDELGNTVEGASVKLFENEADYKAEKNHVFEATTDKKGVARFKEQKAISYFVLVRKGDKDNAGGGEATGKLVANKANKVTVVIQ